MRVLYRIFISRGKSHASSKYKYPHILTERGDITTVPFPHIHVHVRRYALIGGDLVSSC